MDFSSQETTEEYEDKPRVSAEEIYDQENSLEDIAGIDGSLRNLYEEVSAMLQEEEQINDEKPKNAPPVPEGSKGRTVDSRNSTVMNGLQRMADGN